MQIIASSDLINLLKDSRLFLDTCSLISLLKNKDLQKFCTTIKDANCTFTSIPPVVVEFLCAASTAKEQDELSGFLKDQKVLFSTGVESKFTGQAARDFMLAMRRSKAKHPSYVDMLLLFTPTLYSANKKVFLMTSNHSDVPMEFYDRVGLIVCDNDREIRAEGIYRFNPKNFAKTIQ